MNRQQLAGKIGPVSSRLLKEKGYICIKDVFVELGYLNEKDYELWRLKKIPYLEKCIKVNLGTISFIVKTVRRNCENGNLKPSCTAYKSWGKGPKIDLQFSKSGQPQIERVYATHYLKSKQRV